MTYISPYVRLEEEKEKNEKLQAERDQLLSTVETLQAEKATLLEDNAAHLARFGRLWDEHEKMKANNKRRLLFYYDLAQVFASMNPEYTEDIALETLLKIQEIMQNTNKYFPELTPQS